MSTGTSVDGVSEPVQVHQNVKPNRKNGVHFGEKKKTPEHSRQEGCEYIE